MNDFKIKLTTAAAVAAFVLGSLVNPAFAASTIHLSVLENKEAESFSWFFSNENFNHFFSRFFDKKLRAYMNGAQEIPGPGDPDGRGEGQVKINLSKSELCVDLEVENIDQSTAAHIHHAPAGSTGAVVVTLPIPDSEGEAGDCVVVHNELLEKIKNNPQDYYINIHNNPYPNGAIRGQLSR